MSTAKKGDSVSVHYIGKFNDGTEFDNSYDNEPMVFEIGTETLLPDFENAVEGMSIGEKKTISIKAENAYGEYDEDLVFGFKKETVTDYDSIEVGDFIQFMMDEFDEPIELEVVEKNDEGIIADANHELAGKDLTFEIELLSIN